MPQWKLILAYDGTPFHGWQVQPGLATVQGTLGAALRRITGEDILPQGSGRTDTGVHALGQVASFSLDSPIPPAGLLRALNRALPPAIRVLSASHAAPDFHARHSSVAKTYEYRLFPRVHPLGGSASRPDRVCPPWVAPYAWDCPWPIDFEALLQAAPEVLGTHDFTSFAAADYDLNHRRAGLTLSPIRTLHRSTFTRSGDLIFYTVCGTGFLHHMVRNLVGTFVDLASGRLTTPIAQILAARDRAAAGATAPPQGLFLHHVDYPADPGALQS